MNQEQPAQQFPPPPPPGVTHDPYQFIMEPPKKLRPSSPVGGISQNPFLLRLAFLIGGAIAVMVVIALVINIFFGSKTNLNDLIVLTETEQEIIRVAGRNSEATEQGTKNAAITAQLAITTQQQEWLTFLAKRGKQVGSKDLVVKHSALTDQRLTQAKATSTFDITFSQIMRTQLETYAAALHDAYNNASNKQEKELLAEHYKDTQILLEQWPEDTVSP